MKIVRTGPCSYEKDITRMTKLSNELREIYGCDEVVVSPYGFNEGIIGRNITACNIKKSLFGKDKKEYEYEEVFYIRIYWKFSYFLEYMTNLEVFVCIVTSDKDDAVIDVCDKYDVDVLCIEDDV